MKVFALWSALFISFSALLPSQTANGDKQLFDFWVGEWNLWWYGQDSSKEYGTNTITKILDSSVIHEDFVVTSGKNKGYKGQSFSTLEVNTKTWRQTWVDNSGAYMDFTGRHDGADRIFERELTRGGKHIMQQMVFHDITTEGFIWDWMRSDDDGKTWKPLWSIHYQRKK